MIKNYKKCLQVIISNRKNYNQSQLHYYNEKSVLTIM